MKSKNNYKFFFFSAFLLFKLQFVLAQKEVTFSIQAHQDDWQLFMSSNIIDDVENKNNKVVFITLTAGDDGHNKHPFNGGKIPYFLARERGAIYSTKFVADINEQNPEEIPTAKEAIIAYRHPNTGDSVKHTIVKYVYKNTVNYFLRLSDGDRHGQGFKNANFESLQRLKEQKVSSVKAIDCSATYKSWFDLTETIKQIILLERGDAQQVWVNCASTDHSFNKNDHSDHLFASHAVRDAVADFDWVGIASWMDYSSRKKKDNLNNRQYENATATFAVYNWSLIENKYWTDFNSSHRHWLAMDYFKATPPKGTFDDLDTKDKVRSVTSVPMIISYTNPVKSSGKITFFSTMIEKGELEIEITDMNGVLAERKIFHIQEGENNFDFKINNLKSGSYVLNFSLNQKYRQTKKLIVID